MKHILTIIGVLILLAGLTRPVAAYEKEAGEAARLASSAAFQVEKEDSRVTKLRAYLTHVKSPMVGEAEAFVRIADEHNMDWRLVPAIAGLESSFGKRIPTGSYNAFGWAVFTGQSHGAMFKNWEDGIVVVSQGLKKNYIDDGLTTVEAIGNRYSASDTWAPRIRFFMNAFETYAADSTPHVLAMTL